MADTPQTTPTREVGEPLFCVLLLLLGILGYATAMTFSSGHYYDPDMFPKLVSAALVVCVVIEIWKCMKLPKKEFSFQGALQELAPKDVLTMTCLLLAYCFILPEIHFIAASFLFMFAGMFYLHDMKKVVSCAIIAALATAGLVAIFEYIFLVILP